jgi:hypothetical protein
MIFWIFESFYRDYFSNNAFAYFADTLFTNLYNFPWVLKQQDKEIKVKIAKLEEAEQKITTLNLDLKVCSKTLIICWSLSYSSLQIQEAWRKQYIFF